MKKNKYIVPLILVFSLFFLWAISSNLLPTMIRQLMKTCELNTFEASFTETAYWLAYFIFPIPIAMFMKKYSYKAGIIFGLLLAAGGGLLFFPPGEGTKGPERIAAEAAEAFCRYPHIVLAFYGFRHLSQSADTVLHP